MNRRGLVHRTNWPVFDLPTLSIVVLMVMASANTPAAAFGQVLPLSETNEITASKRAFFGDLNVRFQTQPQARMAPAYSAEGPLDFYALIHHPLERFGDERGGEGVLSNWQQLLNAAEAQNETGKRTTFAGFEHIALQDSLKQFRTVIFQGSSVAERPFGEPGVSNPEDLWLWMDNLRARGIESMAIPHSANSLEHSRLRTAQLNGAAQMGKFATLRLRNEPLLGRDLEAQSDLNSTLMTGLTGVWAEENSRPAIYAALRRREIFATTGTRITLFMRAGFRLPGNVQTQRKAALLVKRSVAMGGELGRGRGPLMISAKAIHDAQAQPLQRLQIVKGWAKGAATFEKVYDVACARGALVDVKTHRCPEHIAAVDESNCGRAEGGSAVLEALWKDPEFNPQQAAFYYLRALEHPSCSGPDSGASDSRRKSLPTFNSTLQERAFSSPVWYMPE